jgi:hypothetical protein
VLDVVLDFWRKEVALYRRDTLGRLRGDDVNAEDAAVWLGELNSYLNEPQRRVSLSYNRYKLKMTELIFRTCDHDPGA